MKMPAEMKAKWVEALRSGKYQQTRETLHDQDSGGYCCLGVLEKVCDGEVEIEEEYPDGSIVYESFPTGNWFKSHDIKLEAGDKMASVGSDIQAGLLVQMNDGKFNFQNRTLEGQKTFPEIADWIEENIEVTDRE